MDGLVLTPFSCSISVGHIDVLPDRIYQEANITYVVKNDPRKEAITVRGFAVYFKGVEEERMHR